MWEKEDISSSFSTAPCFKATSSWKGSRALNRRPIPSPNTAPPSDILPGCESTICGRATLWLLNRSSINIHRSLFSNTLIYTHHETKALSAGLFDTYLATRVTHLSLLGRRLFPTQIDRSVPDTPTPPASPSVDHLFLLLVAPAPSTVCFRSSVIRLPHSVRGCSSSLSVARPMLVRTVKIADRASITLTR